MLIAEFVNIFVSLLLICLIKVFFALIFIKRDQVKADHRRVVNIFLRDYLTGYSVTLLIGSLLKNIRIILSNLLEFVSQFTHSDRFKH